ncbi:MAG: TolC family protein [Hyphomicrobiaceae bacterium]|nr:TolC family protein [Hyphomicrobiaceae bacterium]
MVIILTKNRINKIPFLKAFFCLFLSGVFLVGCKSKNIEVTELSCAYRDGPQAHICDPSKSQNRPALGTKRNETKKPLAIGAKRRTAAPIPAFTTSTSTARPRQSTARASRVAPFAPVTTSSPRRASYRDLPSIIRHTMRDNPDIGIAWARERDERTSIEIAKAGYRPTLSVRAAYGPENYDTDTSKSLGVPRQEYGIDLHQNLYDFGRTRGNVDRRKALHNSAGYRRIDKMNQVSLEVAQAYLSILEASQHLTIARQNLASHKDILALVSQSQKAGASSLADVKRVTTRLERAKTNLIDLRSRQQNAREEFIRLTDLRPKNLAPATHLPAPLPPQNISSDNYPDNPKLLSIRADIDSLRAQARTAKANFKPSIDLDVSGNVKENVSGATGMTSGFKGLVSFNYKFLDGDKRLNIARQIQIRIIENKHLYRKKRRAYISELESAIRTVKANIQKSTLLASRASDSAKVLRLYKAQFRDGSKTVFELLDAQLDLFTTKSEKIANHYGKLRSIYEIYALRGDLIGRLLR